MLRNQLYHTALDLMQNDFSHNIPDAGYFEWCARDPNLPEYGPALKELHVKTRQWLKIATTADTPSSTLYLELDLLPDGAIRYFEQAGAWTGDLKQLARASSPSEAMSCLRRYFSEVERWDGLTIPELSRRAQELHDTLSESDAWPVVRP